MREYTIFIDAMSKVFAATGVRVGWSFGPDGDHKQNEGDPYAYWRLGTYGRTKGGCKVSR